ncbi:MAG: hypothetical protein V3R15_00320 [Qipengyuania citrea]
MAFGSHEEFAIRKPAAHAIRQANDGVAVAQNDPSLMVFSRPTAGLPNDGYEIESRFPQNLRTEASMGRVVFIQSFRGSILLAETKSNIPKGLESSRVEADKPLYKNDKFRGGAL